MRFGRSWGRLDLKFEIKQLSQIADVTKLAGFEFTKHIKYADDGEIIAIRALNLKNGTLTLNDIKRIEKSVSDTLTRSKLYKYDIVISYTGTIGECAQIMVNDKYHLAPNVAKIAPNSDIVYPVFLFQYIRSKEFKQQMLNYCHGSTQPTIPMKVIRKLSIPIPPYRIQKQIASILSSIDKKIALNTAINENLEQQAQAIFKSWFVDFEPFGGVMPDDWIITTFDEICVFQNGYAFKSKELLDAPTNDCYDVFKQGHIIKGGGFNINGTKSWYPKSKCEKLSKYILNRKDILMAMTDMKGNVAILGNTAILPLDDQYILNQRVGLLRPKTETGVSAAYIYLLTNSKDFLFDLRSRANSGVQVNLSADVIRNSKIVLAPKTINEAFSAIVNPMVNMILNNQIENQRLSSLRDTLLPKLMNGEIDASEVKI